MDYPIVLVNATKQVNQIQFPIGLAVLTNALRKHQIEPRIIDLMPVDIDQRKEHFLKSLLDEPAIYGFGVIIGNQQIKVVEEYSKLIKQRNPKNLIVYGGPLPTIVPKLLLEHCSCDYILGGECEFTLPKLVQEIRKGDLYPDTEAIKGLYYRQNGSVVGRYPKRLKDLGELSNCDYSLLDMDFYIDFLNQTGQSFEIMSSRGCRGNCTFCYKFMGDGLSAKTTDSTLDEIESVMKKYRIDRFYIVDENFLECKQKFLDFCGEKTARRLNFRFIIQARIDSIDEEICRVGAQSGLRGISTGIESHSNEMLAKINKKITVDETKAKIAFMKKYGIEITANLVLGFPGENEEYYKELYDFVVEHQLQGRIKLSYLTPLPGSAIYRDVLNQGLIKDEYEYISSLDDIYWYQVINLTEVSSEKLDHYYRLINNIGERRTKMPKGELFEKQIRKLR